MSWAVLEPVDDRRAGAVPYLEIVNPPLWEIGHVAWFEEFFCLRGGAFGVPCLHGPGDALYDSARVHHAQRWQLPLPDLAGTRDYVDRVHERSLRALETCADDDDGLYFHRLAALHEMMHIEAFSYTWHTLGWPCPPVQAGRVPSRGQGSALTVAPGEVEVGTRPGPGFVFDNEMWAHPVPVDGFEIGSRPVTNAEYLAFVASGGYETPEWWTPEGRDWLSATGRRMPRHWRRDGAAVGEAWYDGTRELDPEGPVMHVCAHEAEAWCRWAGRRLPTEAEWVRAARCDHRFAWGDSVWEWTASTFGPLEGFAPGPYREYSAPWFGDHRVVRGGSFLTPREMVDVRFRNFYQPHRDDPFLGFRWCRSL